MFLKDLISVSIKKQLNFISIHKENIPLDIFFEDSEILIVNKPSNFVVHPGYGNISGTLFNAILYHYPNNMKLPRAGIVHRLDKNTTGLLLISKTIFSYQYCIKLFKKRQVIKEYDVIVIGRMEENGEINSPIKRNMFNRTKMAINSGGKEAITQYKIIVRFNHYTYIRVRTKTGRMHQIRVHFSSICHPVLGDSVYSRGIQPKVFNFSNKLLKIFLDFSRPALHARMLKFSHPITRIQRIWIVSPPIDMIILINSLYIEDMNP
ncbi:RluA family pseudouridine synthase [Buchnera aphidicola]|uniref:RluA family pseudouridine synthase n=1 Tax=Buchnera aphidicola TaxID=9 RepID=UPI002F953226